MRLHRCSTSGLAGLAGFGSVKRLCGVHICQIRKAPGWKGARQLASIRRQPLIRLTCTLVKTELTVITGLQWSCRISRHSVPSLYTYSEQGVPSVWVHCLHQIRASAGSRSAQRSEFTCVSHSGGKSQTQTGRVAACPDIRY